MSQSLIDTTKIRKTPSGEVIVPLDIWERLLKIAEEVEGWQETIHLLSSAKNRERLFQAIEDIEKGRVESHDLIED